MLFLLAAILFTAWVIGVLTGTMLGGFIHMLPVLSFLIVVVRLMQGERTN